MLPPAPPEGASVAFGSGLELAFSDLKDAQDCANELVGLMRRHGFSVGALAASSDPGNTTEARGHAIWIHSSFLPPPQPNGASLRFASGLILPFADQNAANECAHAIAGTLARHGFNVEIQNN